MTSNSQDGLMVKTEWLSTNSVGGGYVPVQVELTSSRGPRELRVAVLNTSYPVGSEVSQTVILEPNKPLRFTLSVPLTTQNFYGTVHVFERGSELERLRQSGVAGGSGWWGAQVPMFLLVGRAMPDWRTCELAANNFLVGASGQTMQHPVVAPEKMPTRWIDYTMADLVLVPLTELEMMPAASRGALLAWTFAGGNLVVYGVATDRDEATLERLLEFPQPAPAHRPWRLPKPEDRRIAIASSEPGSVGSRQWHHEALVRLDNQGLEAYQRYCAEILDRFGSSLGSINDMNNLAWACVLGADAVPDMARVVQLAEKVVAAQPGSYAYVNTLGVALYRAGRYQDSVARLNQAIALHGGGGTPSDWLFLAMAYYRLDRKEEAERWLSKAVGPGSGNVTDRETTLFQREALALIKSAGDSARPADEPTAGTAGKRRTAETEPDAPVAAHFAIRPMGMGQLVRMSQLDPFPGSEEDWTWLFRSLGADRLRWTARHGMTARGGNSDFWNFLIPDVGRAPVVAFQLLITLFALVIGPVNYFLLRGRRRLYLLVLTVPILALLTSGMLLGYAMAADGFAVRTRVRSVTLLDQARGEAATLSRLSYYAGVAPPGGLRFSADTAVFPLDPPDVRPPFRTLLWTDHQHLSSGWLRSRTPTQLVTVAYRQAGEQLAIATDASGVVRVTNNLGTLVQTLVLADAAGKLYATENLASGGRVLLAPCDNPGEVFEAVRKLAHAQKLEIPPELQERGAWDGVFPWSRRWGRQASASWSNGQLEETLRRHLGDAVSSAVLEPRTYVAITERPPLVELGTSETQDAGSLYVIVGMY